jgi:hypothetical protein
VLTIADSPRTDINAMIVRFKNRVFGNNLGPDQVVEQTAVEEISLKKESCSRNFLVPLLQESATLFIRYGAVRLRLPFSCGGGSCF